MTTRAAVEGFLAGRRLALAGASRTGRKFGNTVLRELRRQGYDVTPVHPQAARIDGVACRGTVGEVAGPVDGLVAVVPPEAAAALVRQAAAAGIRRVWLQQGAESPAALAAARELGVDVVHGECILMHAAPRGVHRAHRWLWGLLGRLPRDP